MKKFNTEQERKAFKEGIKLTKQYIAFCIKHYPLKINIAGLAKLYSELPDFLDDGNYITNTEGLTFEQFCERCSKK